MAGFIDFHPHAFPDRMAPAAIASLEKQWNIKAYLASMDRGGIFQSVLCSIATRPEHFTSIL